MKTNRPFSQSIFLWYFVSFFVLELIFVFIQTDMFFRSYATDVFAVMYVHFLCRWFGFEPMKALTITFIIAYSIETIQYFELFNDQMNWFTLLVVGGTFDLFDYIAYGLGLAMNMYI